MGCHGHIYTGNVNTRSQVADGRISAYSGCGGSFDGYAEIHLIRCIAAPLSCLILAQTGGWDGEPAANQLRAADEILSRAGY